MAQAAGKATGSLTVGRSAIRLAHAYAFPEPAGDGGTGYRLLVTDRPLTPAALERAAAAGRDDGARQELAVELADRRIRGLEAVVGADPAVTRLNVYSAESAMGMMLLTTRASKATTFDGQQVAGRFWTSSPIEDARIGKTIQYDVTFAAPVHGSR